MEKKEVLVTNDDGFDSFFLRVLVDRLLEEFSVTVVAPASEQSWIGRGISRQGTVSAKPDDSLGCPGWRIGGTPTDCVNIGLEHLVEKRPAAVISGINLGFNTTVPLVLSSGTIAGALEGSFSDIPAIAFSKIIPQEIFEKVRISKGFVEGDYFESLENSAAHARRMVSSLIRGEWFSRQGTVHNINFPVGVTAETPIRRTVPVNMKMAGLFERQGEDFVFRYRQGILPDDRPGTDVGALEDGEISHSLIDFTILGVPE
ncbi:5'/3'-nucleotidase SurE [Puniceicoccus vermicola]|uniref:5'-nucleotidase n=1 Tax=Puniceicoccus vermicola TaxID=388746 RepID=A0A7X1E5Q3_9BACT|nr:5'/3'-nucleotidase SurE [Puniceicoccus vermicola]MBC2603890.1 5'/3'-nucleotidase SurE [Puniceicoccus vermicola]